MKKTLKSFAVAMLVAGATVTIANAQTTPYAIHNVSVHWTAYLPDTSTTNSKTGTITDTYKTTAISTTDLITNLAAAVGVTVKPSASLVAISELALGTNLSDGTNIVTAVYKYTNSTGTNFEYSTNAIPTNTVSISNTVILNTNLSTNFEYAITNTIMVTTNITYYIKDGTTLTPLTNASSMLESQLISGSLGSLASSTNNINLAQMLTNSIFKGTIKTNLAVTGTVLTSGYFDVNAAGAGNVSKSAGPDVYFSGRGVGTAVTATYGKGKTALPWSTLNLTVDGYGSGTVGGTYYASSTNISGGVTNVYYSITNATTVFVSGAVTHTFSKLVQ